MITNPGHHLYRTIGQHVKLLNLTTPEGCIQQVAADVFQHLLGVFLLNGSCGYHQIAGKMCVRHDVTMLVNIVIITIVRLDTNDGQALVNRDIDMTGLCLVTLDILDERILLQLLLDVTDIHMAHLVANRITP